VMTSPGYATQGGYSILKAGFFASVGLVAAGAFHREIAMNEAFEILVQERAKEISKQAERLLLVGLALEASETAAERKAIVAEAMSESMETLTHELRTPLQGVMGITSMLLDDPTLSVDAQESLTVVMTSSFLLLTLINNLLDVRKCDADMMDEFQLDEVSMRSALADAVDFCKPFAIISNVDLKVNLDGAGGVYAESNFLRFQQIMINLISNAIKYTAKGSAVSVGVEVMTLARAKADIKHSMAAGSHQSYWDGRPWNQIKVAVISVSDSGAGIARDGADSLFGKFSQLDSSPTNKLGDQSVSHRNRSGTKFVHEICQTDEGGHLGEQQSRSRLLLLVLSSFG
jgi:signal transduction histidine kinase